MDAGSLLSSEIERRYANVRAALAREGLDALVVSGSAYLGFDGAVAYLSGFWIIDRYAYVLLPLEGAPSIVFPSEGRYVGDHSTTWIDDRVFADAPGAWLSERIRQRGWQRVGVYGLDYVMNVRDYRELGAAGAELVSFDIQFDLARAVKSDLELESVREAMRIIEEGFWILLDAYEPGKTEAAILAPVNAFFTERGAGFHMANFIHAHGGKGSARAEGTIASPTREVSPDDLLVYSLEIAGPGGHWVELSRPIINGEPSRSTAALAEAYGAYHESISSALRAGVTAHDVHRLVSQHFGSSGFRLGHLTGHSIGMTMIENPRISDGVDVELRENMVVSLHPHVIASDGSLLYMQDTYRVTRDGAERLSDLVGRMFTGTERRA